MTKAINWLQILNEKSLESGETLLSVNDVFIPNLKSISLKSICKFQCKCWSLHHKSINSIIRYGGLYCKTCTVINSKEKSKATVLAKYGVEYLGQLESVKNKMKISHKATCLARYGVEYPGQLDSVQKKMKIARQANKANFISKIDSSQ